MRIRYIATGKASWDNGLADILPQNLPNKHSRKKNPIPMIYRRTKWTFIWLDSNSFNTDTPFPKSHIISMNYLQYQSILHLHTLFFYWPFRYSEKSKSAWSLCGSYDCFCLCPTRVGIFYKANHSGRRWLHMDAEEDMMAIQILSEGDNDSVNRKDGWWRQLRWPPPVTSALRGQGGLLRVQGHPRLPSEF